MTTSVDCDPLLPFNTEQRGHSRDAHSHSAGKAALRAGRPPKQRARPACTRSRNPSPPTHCFTPLEPVDSRVSQRGKDTYTSAAFEMRPSSSTSGAMCVSVPCRLRWRRSGVGRAGKGGGG
eukprot:364559-Chlamydomonas_euryale.AAC.2